MGRSWWLLSPYATESPPLGRRRFLIVARRQGRSAPLTGRALAEACFLPNHPVFAPATIIGLILYGWFRLERWAFRQKREKAQEKRFWKAWRKRKAQQWGL